MFAMVWGSLKWVKGYWRALREIESEGEGWLTIEKER